MLAQPALSVASFDEFAMREENADKRLEWVEGEVVTVPSNILVSHIASVLIGLLRMYLTQHLLGYVTGEAGGYQVDGERYAPDVAFIRKERAILDHKGYHPNPPDLAVEIEGEVNAQTVKRLQLKLLHYRAAQTTVWVVYPETKTVVTYAPNGDVRVLNENDTLDGGNVLPNFHAKVAELFVV